MGDASSAQRLLAAALAAHPGPLGAADEADMEALQTLVFVGFFAGRAESWEDARRQFARVAPEPPETLALDSLQSTSDPMRITRLTATGAYLDRMRRARDPLWHLVYGEQLRRAQSPADARIQLGAALDAFRDLGASPWVDRAQRELRAAGGTASSTEGLTPQEAAVARLAATGLTNKEIAAQLFLSPPTVSTHLARVFPKLGITSRGSPRDALDQQTEMRH